jgi:asparagine synthase (glutamine-hydrolysing)
MSAIFGILRFDGGEVAARDLERMGNALAHRGPDGRKFVVDGPLGLGHCLMRVNREDLFEAQPLYDREAKITLVADLRIDNREELAAAFGLSAAELRDLPDSALVLRAYKKWGENCAEHLLGDFAFAVWDGPAKKLVLGRDHMGQRHIHYHKGADFLVFATEIKALWALAEVPRKISETQLGRFLVRDARPREGATLFEDISAVPGATIIAVRPNKITARRYWEPHADPEHIGRDEAYYVETYRRILAEAVACRIRRLTAPPALCLSAGYDSSAIAGLAGPVLAAKGQKLITLSSVLPEDYRGPLSCPRRWVELCRRDMPHLDVRYCERGKNNLFTNIDGALLATDGIPNLGHYVVDALFREAARGGSRLVMDGLGGDHTLNHLGYDALAYFLRTGRIGRFFSEFGPHLRLSGHSLWQTLRSDIVARLAPLWARRAWKAARRGFAPFWSTVPMAPGFASGLLKTGAIVKEEMMERFVTENSLRTVNLRGLSKFPAAYAVVNDTIAAAAHGLDTTRPMADKRVVEFGLAIPEELHVKHGRNRYLARRALADVYPPEFQTRSRHRDMLVPDLAEMVRDCRPMLMTEIGRLRDNPKLRKYIDFDRLASMALEDSASAAEFTPKSFAVLRTLVAAKYVAWLDGGNF